MQRKRQSTDQPDYDAGKPKRPVSCAFCRSRKLRCTRVFPCSNCVARGISCQIHASEPGSSSPTPDVQHNNVSLVSQADILKRLQRLEELFQNQISGQNLNHLPRITGGLEKAIPSPADTQPDAQPQTPAHLLPIAADIARLEKLSAGGSYSESLSPDPIIFRICPIQQIPKMSRYIRPDAFSNSSQHEAIKCIWLPQYDEAKVFVQYFIDNITYRHHVIHTPSLWIMIDELYVHLNSQAKIEPGRVALLLSILASATSLWTPMDPDGTAFPTVTETRDLTSLWIRATEDVLDYANRTALVSLEIIQAMVILSFVIVNLVGLAQRYSNMISTAITMARSMGLHRCDHPNNLEKAQLAGLAQMDTVQTETGRRVWWYLTGTDWMASCYGGPTHNSYLCNPAHMAVNHPQNANDEDLTDEPGHIGKPLSEPTAMAYFLQRVRFATMVLPWVDRTPFAQSGHELRSYDEIMNDDAQLKVFIDEIPAFFHMDREKRGDFSSPDVYEAPHIVIQRYLLNSLIHIVRCKLHLPYLVRGSVDPAYKYSHSSCLEAARHVIQNELLLEQSGHTFARIRLRFSGILQAVYIASIVLLLDKCLHTASEQQEAGRFEVTEAFRILEDSRGSSPQAEKLLEVLMEVLRKHKIAPPITSPRRPEMANMAPDQNNNMGWQNGNPVNLGFSTYFDGSMPNFDLQGDFDTIDWSSILSGLGSSCI